MKSKRYSRLTELATSLGDLFLKVADFQFTYVKIMFEKKKMRRDILWQ